MVNVTTVSFVVSVSGLLFLFRRPTKVQPATQQGRPEVGGHSQPGGSADWTCAKSVVSLLLDFGYAREMADSAVAACGPDIHAALDFCSGPRGFGGPSAGADAPVARKG